jgi:hypothetical protein
MNKDIDVITITQENIQLLVDSSTPYLKEGWEFKTWEYGCLKGKDYPNSKEIDSLIENLSVKLNGDGYFLLDLSFLVDNYPANIVATVSTFILSLVGKPIKIFDKLETHWRKVGVNLNKNPNKSEGIGKSPLHMDFVNAEYPPDYVCLFAIRHDEQMGGQSILADFEDIERTIPVNQRRELFKSQFSDGKVEYLSNIGGDINPFPIISKQAIWKYRITGNLLTSEVPTEASLAITYLFNELEKRKVSFLLKKGYYLVINQHKLLHGKEPLGTNQASISEDKRRLLMHGFVKKITT